MQYVKKAYIIETISQLHTKVTQRSTFQVLTCVCDTVLKLYKAVISTVNKKSVEEKLLNLFTFIKKSEPF